MDARLRANQLEASIRQADTQVFMGSLPMGDGVGLAYTVWLAREGFYGPAVLAYSCYWDSGPPFDVVEPFLDRDFAYVGVNVRGSGASGGRFSYFDPQQVIDGVAVIAWIAEQAWCDGAVGMVGASYGAHLQLAIAAHGPPSLKAIVPVSVDGCEYDDEAYPGGLFNAGLFLEWTHWVQPELERIGVENRRSRGRTQDEVGEIRRNFSDVEARNHPYFDAWWRERSLLEIAHLVDVPTLIIQAWQDEYIRPNGAIELFCRLPGPNKRLCLQNGPHRLAATPFNRDRQLSWLDRWLKKNPPASSGTAEAVEVLWAVGAETGPQNPEPAMITSYSAWPPAEVSSKLFRLDASGALNADPGGAVETEECRTFVPRFGFESLRSAEAFQMEPNPVGALDFTTAPLEQNLAILGSPQLRLVLTADAAEVEMCAILKEIDERGNCLFLQRTVFALRLVDPEEEGQRKRDPEVRKMGDLPPKCFDIQLSAVAHVLTAGGQLQLTLSGPPVTPDPVWAFELSRRIAVVTTIHGPAQPCSLTLPVLDDATWQISAADVSNFRSQPTRFREE